MVDILLIRHGENDMLRNKLAGRLANVHLNENGQAQARRLAEEFSTMPVKAVFSSPLERAQETAQPIAQSHHLEVEILPALIEIDFGKWAGKNIKQLKRGRFWNTVQEKPSEFQFPDGERFVDAQERVVNGLISLSERFAEKDLVVCVSHSDVIRLAVAYFLGMSLDHFQRLRIRPASVTALTLNGGKGYFGPINQSFSELKI